MSRSSRELTIRSYREGDEAVLAEIFSRYATSFFGPERVTADSWLGQFRTQSWTGPSLDADPECGRIAEREGKTLAYAITDYEPMWMSDGALIQELCAAETESADEAALALIEDAEQRARQRGKSFIAIQLAQEDGRAAAAAAASGYCVEARPDEVFMATVTDLPRFLSEIAGELGRRVGESEFRDWRGVVRISSEGNGRETQSCDLCVSGGRVEVSGAGRGRPDVDAAVGCEGLPLLLLGRQQAGDLYLQARLSVGAADVREALRLLEVLFTRVPLFLPRAQWW